MHASTVTTTEVRKGAEERLNGEFLEAWPSIGTSGALLEG
jgi:hypothetical protein